MHKEKSTPMTGTSRAVLGAVIALAWPTMLEQLMQTAVQYVDTAMVGSLGTQATAAAGSTTTVNWLILITISAVGVGFLSFIAQAWGAGEQEKARRAAYDGETIICRMDYAPTGKTYHVTVSPVIHDGYCCFTHQETADLR